MSTLKLGDKVKLLRSTMGYTKGTVLTVAYILEDGTVEMTPFCYLYGPSAVQDMREGNTWARVL